MTYIYTSVDIGNDQRLRAKRIVDGMAKSMGEEDIAKFFDVPSAWVSLAARASWYCPEFVVKNIITKRVLRLID